jgi:hypothetical protein
MKINFLWIGSELNKIGQLSLKSFIDNGHESVLWAYDKNCKNIPYGTIVEDAGQIIHPDKIFSYKGDGDCRKNSYGGFSDIFRYYLLQEVGGWYCDMDVTCLKNFEEISSNEYVIRPHNMTKYVGNILKTPKNNEFLKACIEETEKEINETNYRWIKPLEILSDQIEKFQLEKYVVPTEYFGKDDIVFLKELLCLGFNKKSELPKYAIHWCNEAVSTGQWDSSIRRDWNSPIPTTLYYRLLKKHNLL